VRFGVPGADLGAGSDIIPASVPPARWRYTPGCAVAIREMPDAPRLKQEGTMGTPVLRCWKRKGGGGEGGQEGEGGAGGRRRDREGEEGGERGAEGPGTGRSLEEELELADTQEDREREQDKKALARAKWSALLRSLSGAEARAGPSTPPRSAGSS